MHLGGSWVYVITAYERGHCCLDAQRPLLFGDEADLRTDCFAGASLTEAEEDGTLQLEAGDKAKMAASLNEIGDNASCIKAGVVVTPSIAPAPSMLDGREALLPA